MRIESESSMIQHFDYDSEKAVLQVKFRSGKTYAYQKVPETVFEEMRSADSHGRFFNENIRGQYE